MYKFKYHPDNQILRCGLPSCGYEQFMAANPGFPIIDGDFFELKQDGSLEIITSENHHKVIEDLAPYQELIQAIEALDGKEEV